MLHQSAEAPAGKDFAEITEQTGETHGGGGGALGGEVGDGNADEALRAVYEKPAGAEQQQVQQLRVSGDFPEEQDGDAGQHHESDARMDHASAKEPVGQPAGHESADEAGDFKAHYE